MAFVGYVLYAQCHGLWVRGILSKFVPWSELYTFHGAMKALWRE